MSRRIIPILCALVVAVVPATALAQPIQDPSPAAKQTGVVYGDTKYDLQNTQDQTVANYDAAISGDTKGNLPRAIAPAGTKPENRVSDIDRVGSLTPAQLAAAYGTTKPANGPVQTAAPDNDTSGWQLAAWVEAAVIAALAIGAAVFFVGRQHRAPRMGV
jgi:hypothetical protein